MRTSTKILAPWAALAVLLAVLEGCSSAPVQHDVVPADTGNEYGEEKARLEASRVISPGFLLRIRHSADSGISGEFRVTFKGELKLPYKVKVTAAGLTPEELSRKLANAYKPYFKSRNSVTVDIASREYLIEARGLVKKPGIYPVKLDTHIEEIIALAGGLITSEGDAASPTSGAGGAKPEYIRIVRPNAPAGQGIRWIRLTDYFLRYDIRNEVLWRGGEQLFFQITGDASAIKTNSQTVRILGEVKAPGEYPLQAGADLFTYIARAGGQTTAADLSNITIIRRAGNQSSTHDISHSSATIDLAPGDMIVVKPVDTRPSAVERFGPIVISLGSLAVAILVAFLAL